VDSILLYDDSTSIDNAIKRAGEALVAGGFTKPEYTDEILQNAKFFGAYVLLTDNIALVHARPSENVLHTGMSFVSLNKPIFFTSEDVICLVAIAAKNPTEHLEIIATIASILGDRQKVKELKSARTKEEFLSVVMRKPEL
jgi:PTS system ascorbate-specific IIA component